MAKLTHIDGLFIVPVSDEGFYASARYCCPEIEKHVKTFVDNLGRVFLNERNRVMGVVAAGVNRVPCYMDAVTGTLWDVETMTSCSNPAPLADKPKEISREQAVKMLIETKRSAKVYG